ncbi:MAG: efflux RND transporter periplasmic adaptor subunit [Flavobacteriales bacterium]|nr:efflux RND transporter periplasmic adaptor subunit [Flavobacteriales bacterium]
MKKQRLFSDRMSIVLLLLLLGVSSCGSEEIVSETNEETDSGTFELTVEQINTAGILIGNASQMEFNDQISLNGHVQIYPDQSSLITSYYGGNISEIKVKTGEKVSKDQVVVMLENPEFIKVQQDYLNTKLEYDNLLVEYDRQKELSKDNISSVKQFQETEKLLIQSKNTMFSLKSQLGLLGISADGLSADKISAKVALRSPIEGVVAEIFLPLGGFVSQEVPAMKITNTTSSVIVLDAFESHISKLNSDLMVKIKLLNSVKEYNAKIVAISPNVNDQSKSIQVYCQLIDSQDELLPGSYVSAQLNGVQFQAFGLPIDALQKDGGQYFVWQVIKGESDNYLVEKLPVQVGAINSDKFEILNPTPSMEAGQFIIKGGFNL